MLKWIGLLCIVASAGGTLVSATAEAKAKSLSPSTYDRELLDLFRLRLDFGLDRKTWQYGPQVKVVKSPARILRFLDGVYYSGRLKIRRFGTDLTLPLKDYKWNPDKGNRWIVLEQFIYWDSEQNGWAYGWSGGQTNDYHEFKEFTEVELGEAMDFAPFIRIYENRNNLVACATGGWAVTAKECEVPVED